MKRIFALALPLAGLIVLAGCGGHKESGSRLPDGPPKAVRLASAERLPSFSYEEQMGTVTARNRADIQTKVQARVERIPVALGDRVRQGDLLAELDTREFRARVQQAKALADQAAEDLKRFETLLGQNAATQQEYDGVKARAAVAAAGLQEAEAMLTYARIVAPFAGTVTRKSIEVGDLAVPGRPLFVVEDTASLQFVVSVSESRRGRFAVGDTMWVAMEAEHVRIPAVVEELSPSADPNSRTFITKLSLPDHPGLRPGLFGRLLVPTLDDYTGIFIPTSALVRRGQLELVYVVSPDNRALLRLVRTGRTLEDRIEILSGISEGERVVASEADKLTDGDPVEEQS